MTTSEARTLVSKKFAAAAIPVESLLTRDYPEETVFVVNVSPAYLTEAARLGNEIDELLHTNRISGFVAVRATLAQDKKRPVSRTVGVADDRVPELIALISSRARTSESQPSLHYVPDAAANLSRVMSRRHSLVFGRRGAGKTALMLEAKRQLVRQGHVVVWLNLQTYRRESVSRIGLWVASKVADAVYVATKEDAKYRHLADGVAGLRSSVEQSLGLEDAPPSSIHRLIPKVHAVIHRFCEAAGKRVYVFLDDCHYVSRSAQPDLLDVLHGFFRDSDAWLKVAMIRNLSKWFRVDPPAGLQAGQDADAIDLDLTLQQPARAKQFLEEVLGSFARHHGIASLTSLYAPEALDRLVLASGAVPRDYLVLAAEALGHARSRGKGRLVGKQDVVRAAGDIAQKKLAELDEDATSSTGSAQHMLAGLQALREFCVDDKRATYFQVDFKDKEKRPEEYALLQALMDVRLVHLVNSSVSDTHRSGERSEAYMLDLSQFSGERFKKHLKVLDFEGGHMVLRETGKQKAPRLGDTPRKLITILRGAPDFELANLSAALGEN